MLFACLLAAVQWAKADMDVQYVVTFKCVEDNTTTEVNVESLPWYSANLMYYKQDLERENGYHEWTLDLVSCQPISSPVVSLNNDNGVDIAEEFSGAVELVTEFLVYAYDPDVESNTPPFERTCTFEIRIAKYAPYSVIKAIEDIKYNGIKPDDEVGANIGNTQEEYIQLSAEDKAAVYNYQDLLDEAAAYQVVKLIDVAGKGINEDGAAEKVAAAREKFNKLTSSQKTLTGIYATVLEKCEEQLSNQAIAAVDDLIAAIGEVVYTDECKGKIDAAKTAYVALTKAQQEGVQNYAALTAAESAYALLKDKAEFETYKGTKKTAAEALGQEGDSGAVAALITTAKQSIDGLAYDEAMTLDENKAEVDAIVTSLESDIADQKAEEKLAAEKAEFETYKGSQKTAAEALGQEGDSEAVAALIADAKKAIDEATYDEAKSLDENKAVLDAIVSEMATNVQAQRAAEKLAADKAVAADVDVLIEAIGEVVYNNACKAKVSEARKAYDALTADQKNLVENLATLEAAEAKLVELTPEPTDINIAPATGADIYTALVEATDGKVAKNISIELAKGGEYTISGSIEAPASIVINGNGATIDATALTGAFINEKSIIGEYAMKDEENASEFVIVDQVKIEGVTVKGLTQSLINNASGKKVLYTDITIDNSIIEVSGSKVFFALGTAFATNATIKNSTIWSNEGHKAYLFQAQGRPKDVNSAATTTWTIDQCTIVNIAVGKKCNNNNSGIKGQGTTYMVLKNSILYNFGSNTGNEVNGWLWGQNGGANSEYSNNTYWSAEGAVEGWTDASKGGSDRSETAVQSDPEFKNAAEGDFSIAVSKAQAKSLVGDLRWIDIEVLDVIAKIDEIGEVEAIVYNNAYKAKIGDARKAYDALTADQKATVENYAKLEAAEARLAELTPAPEDINIAPETGADIYTALVEATDGKVAKNISIELAEGGEYTISGSIEAPASIVINGNGATIDATALTGAFINEKSIIGEYAMKDEENASEFVIVDQVKIEGVTVKGLTQSLINNASGKKVLYTDITIDNSIIEVSGSKVFFALGTAFATNATIKNSTIWSNEGHKAYLFQAQGRPKDVNSAATTTWTIDQCTIVNIAVGKKCNNNNSGIKGQGTTYMVLKNSILYNFGSNTGNEVNGWLWGQNGGANSEYSNNTYWSAEGAVEGWTDASKGGSDRSETAVQSDPEFKNAAEGDFSIAADKAQAKSLVGDLRWIEASGEVTAVKDVEVVESAKKGIYNLKGEKLAKPQRGLNIIDGKLILVK